MPYYFEPLTAEKHRKLDEAVSRSIGLFGSGIKSKAVMYLLLHDVLIATADRPPEIYRLAEQALIPRNIRALQERELLRNPGFLDPPEPEPSPETNDTPIFSSLVDDLKSEIPR
ncbi:hypothetical protein WG66_002809 [Moniliophthora roreri]|uniref:Uncharacterized protein n=1 Tax=Moniliophthora roreri TaxID=221103 RepID=A0A0W0G9W7_MONRR|nr:hypothetical protein WG66_002809 [Moniliophthora roreri]